MRSGIVDDIVSDSPRAGADLLRDLVHSEGRVFERVDDSDGVVADVFRDAVQDWGRAWYAVTNDARLNSPRSSLQNTRTTIMA